MKNGCFVQAGVDVAVLVFGSLRLCVEKHDADNTCHFGMKFDRIPFCMVIPGLLWGAGLRDLCHGSPRVWLPRDLRDL